MCVIFSRKCSKNRLFSRYIIFHSINRFYETDNILAVIYIFRHIFLFLVMLLFRCY
jgi:hypothetical protein